jgi:hypothetical protein
MNVRHLILLLVIVKIEEFHGFSSASFATSRRPSPPQSQAFRRVVRLSVARQQGQVDFYMKKSNRRNIELSESFQRISLAFKSFFRAAIQGILLPFAMLYRILFQAVTSFVASFLTALLKDPALNMTLACLVMEGMNQFLTQSDVKSKIFMFQQTMANTEPAMSIAKQTGNDFFHVFVQFLEGIFSPPAPKMNLNDKEEAGVDENESTAASSIMSE